MDGPEERRPRSGGGVTRSPAQRQLRPGGDGTALDRLEDALAAVLPGGPGDYALPGAPDRGTSVSKTSDPEAARDFVAMVDGQLGSVFMSCIAPRCADLLAPSQPSARPWFAAPATHTIRSARSLGHFGLGAVAVAPESAQPYAIDLAAWITIGRAAALVLDDAVDHSLERMGAPSAVATYGSWRCGLAFGHAVAAVMRFAAGPGPGSVRDRASRTALLAQLTVQAIATQTPGPPPTLRRALRRSRYHYAHLWWIFLAADPSPGRLDPSVVKDMVGHFSTASKILNDLRDYYGRGTKPRLEDFSARKVTIPVTMLLSRPIAPEHRALVVGHFRATRSTLEPDAMLGLLEHYAVRTAATSLALGELRAAWELAQAPAGLPPTAIRFMEVMILYMWAQAVADAHVATQR